MLILIAFLLALIPALAILYPFLRRAMTSEPSNEDGSFGTELARRWESALAGLKSAELDRAVGTLSDEDYRQLRHWYMTEAALVMKEMELGATERRELLADVRREADEVRTRAGGAAEPEPADE